MYDAIVVGARCAGAPTAMLLARRGYRVLLVDRATFPSDLRQSTLLIHQPGVAYLEQWGLLERVRASAAPPIRRWLVDMGPLVFTGSPPPCGHITDAIAPRRTVLDKILLDGAIAADVEVREAFTVDDILIEDGTVTGIRGTDRSGKSFTDKARIVVGAEGHRSMVAKAVNAPEYNQREPRICTFYTYWNDVTLHDGIQFEFYPRAYRGIYALPTNDGQLLIGANWRVSEFDEVRQDPETYYMKVLDECAPDLATRVRAGKRGDDFVGGYAQNVFRRPFGAGWALVGDAGASYEFTTAQGITNAFRQAAGIAVALDQGLAGTRPMTAALSDFEQQRNAVESVFYDFTYRQATLEPPPPEAMPLFSAIHRSQAATNAFFGLFAQTSNPVEFFSPAHLNTLMGV
jgi:2-polyprenyl-6-methoxyphenol hydroxylase-like FAD-dependent oxidoreductase